MPDNLLVFTECWVLLFCMSGRVNEAGMGDARKDVSETEDIRLWALVRPAVDPVMGLKEARLEDGGPLEEEIPALDKSRADGT